MRHHLGETGTFGELHRVEGLRDRSDLIDLDQDRIGCFLLDASPENLLVGDEKVIAD